jgi:5-methylcytosine-specific restriction endonuclease McrA
MRAGGEIRGSAADRRARRIKLICTYGDGVKVACVHCSVMVEDAGMEVDKIIPGSQGGRYVWANILPSCISCNRKRSDKTTVAEIRRLQGMLILTTTLERKQFGELAI